MLVPISGAVQSNVGLDIKRSKKLKRSTFFKSS